MLGVWSCFLPIVCLVVYCFCEFLCYLVFGVFYVLVLLVVERLV